MSSYILVAPVSHYSLPCRVQFFQRTVSSLFFIPQYHPFSKLPPFVIRSEVLWRRCGVPAVKNRQTATGIWSDFMLEQRWLTTCKIHPQRMLMGAWNMAKKWIGSHRAHVFFGEMLWTILKRKSLKSRCEYLLWHQWSYSSALEVCFHTAVWMCFFEFVRKEEGGVPGLYDSQINVN